MGNLNNVIPAEAGNAQWYDSRGNRQDMMLTDSAGTKGHG
jgi:hypothetical protein